VGYVGRVGSRWYEEAVVYCLDVRRFYDWDGDGVGDLPGLTRRLHHLAGLGVNCLWLLPIYATPYRDDGYDVEGHYAVDPRIGDLGDVAEMLEAAEECGIRVVLDLVVNHTSDRHPWFQEARAERRSPRRDFYLWSDDPRNPTAGMAFPGEEESVWEWDEAAGQYYFHRFYEHEPDLNLADPAVRREIARLVGFWASLGVSGFRVDAAPFVAEKVGRTGDGRDGHDFFRHLRSIIDAHRGEQVLMAEANVPPDEMTAFFGDGAEMHLVLNFLLNANLFLALAREEAEPLQRALRRLPEVPSGGCWANFVRNHDELTLSPLEPPERDEVLAAFAPQEEMRIYGHGIRRRLPPMLGGDRRRLELAYSLVFALPGTPILRYGEEIGMGDDLSLPGRESGRTPMQWSPGPNAGFSTAPADRLIRPVISSGPFAYRTVNVANQQRDPGSFMNWMERLIRTRRSCPELGRGSCEQLEVADPRVLGLRYEWRGEAVVVLHNLGSGTTRVPRDALGHAPGLLDLLGGDRDSAAVVEPELRLPPYGYRWLRVSRAALS
jgi:maltose alpha-D-glucosyltransferase/alpha-amylase